MATDLSIARPEAAPLLLRGQLYRDFAGRSEFIGFLLPQGEATPEAAALIADGITDLRRLISERFNVSGSTFVGDPLTTGAELVFSGRVFIYHRDQLSARQRADLEELFEARTLSLILRGPDYLATQLILDRAGDTR